MSEEKYTPEQLEEMATALLTAEDQKAAMAPEMEIPVQISEVGDGKKGKGKLDDKTISALPAAVTSTASSVSPRRFLSCIRYFRAVSGGQEIAAGSSYFSSSAARRSCKQDT